MRDEKWDRRFLELAKHIASWSRDPSTKTGAVIADGKRIVSVGYNGFPQGVDDSPERYADRELKYRMVCHCERNALQFAERPVRGCTLYTWPFVSCATCAGMVIQAGVKRVVAPVMTPEIAERWKDECAIARLMFSEAGVVVDILEF